MNQQKPDIPPALGRHARPDGKHTASELRPLSGIEPKPSSSRQTSVRRTAEQDALRTGVWNPDRQKQAQQGNPWVLLAIVIVCSLSSFVAFQSIFRPAPRSISSASAPQALPQAVTTSSNEEQVASVSFGKESVMGTTETTTSSVILTPVVPTGSLPANQITLEQLDYIAGSGSQPVLHFKDGSSLVVDNNTLQQLPSDVRLRITYSRGRDEP